MRRRGKSRKLIRRSLIQLGIIAFFWGMAEWTLRFAVPHIQPLGTDRHLFCDKRYGTSPGLRPLAKGRSHGIPVEVDLHGCRAGSRPYRPGRPGWLLVGDSVTFGIGVPADSTFAGLLHAWIDTIHVFNPSLIGYGVSDYERVVRDFIQDRRDLGIKHVTICWCLNDVQEDLPDIAIPGGTLRSLFPDLLLWLRSKSRLYQWLKARLFDRPKQYYQFDAPFYTPGNAAFQKAIRTLVRIDSLCKRQGVACDLVILPYAYQWRDPSARRPQWAMKSALEEIKIPVFDPLEALFPIQKPESLYLYGDGIHFSESGHRLLGRYLEEAVWIRRRPIISQSPVLNQDRLENPCRSARQKGL